MKSNICKSGQHVVYLPTPNDTIASEYVACAPDDNPVSFIGIIFALVVICIIVLLVCCNCYDINRKIKVTQPLCYNEQSILSKPSFDLQLKNLQENRSLIESPINKTLFSPTSV